MFNLGFNKDGPVYARELCDVFEELGEILNSEFSKRDAEIRRLRKELDDERRLRIAMSRRSHFGARRD